MTQEKRTDKRLSVYLPINYDILGSPKKEFGNTTSKDLSSNGIRILTNKFFPTGTKFFIKLHLTDINRIMEIEAEGKWSSNIQFSNNFHSGLRFTNLNTEQEKILEEYVYFKKKMEKEEGLTSGRARD